MDDLSEREQASLLPSSRANAKRVGSVHYFTGKPCKNGHIAKRQTINGSCASCRLGNEQARKEADPQKYKDKVRKYYLDHREQRLADAKAWRQANAERIKITSKAWREANPERERAKKQARSEERRGRKECRSRG